MNLGVILTVFALVFVAELPDKTMIATVVMGSRFRPVLVWIGATAAFLVHVTVAVAIGRLLELLPHRWVEGVTALLFAAGAAYLLFVPEKAEEKKGEEEGEENEEDRRGLRVISTAFVVILVGEFGDLTQILTANLAAKYDKPSSVFIGAIVALSSVAAIGAFGGRALVRIIPLSVIRKVGGVLLAGFAVYTLVSLVRG